VIVADIASGKHCANLHAHLRAPALARRALWWNLPRTGARVNGSEGRVRDIEAVLFDFGGVFTVSPFEALAGPGHRADAPPPRTIELIFGPYHEDTDHPWHRLERGEIPLERAREDIIALGRAEGVDSDPFRLFEFMGRGDDAAARLRMEQRARDLRARGYRTALVTNNVREFSGHWRRMIATDEIFDAIIDSSAEGVRKPDPRIYRLALERLGGVAPERAMFLDDFPPNVEAARRLGIHGVLVQADHSEALAALDALLARAAPLREPG